MLVSFHGQLPACGRWKATIDYFIRRLAILVQGRAREGLDEFRHRRSAGDGPAHPAAAAESRTVAAVPTPRRLSMSRVPSSSHQSLGDRWFDDEDGRAGHAALI